MKLPNFHLFKRSFISLVITPQHLKVIKINVKTNSVIKFAEVQLPPGIIVNYRVKDKDTLVKYIKELWAKNRLSDKYVGVVVPEFSTYTKSLSLPNLTDIELSEALSWRMQEFLPVSLDEVVFDWRALKREKEEAKVQVVAILKDVLFGYIDAVGVAGLSPLVVETPSLSIQRIIGAAAGGKLIIYVNSNETILVVSDGEEIIASSVVTSENFNQIVTTAQQMLAHYSNVSIQKVIISGVGLTQDLVQFLNYNLGRGVQLADIKVKGLLPVQVQNFLVGISLQHKDPAEPESELTINLLPPSWAEYYKKQSTGIRAWTLTLATSIIIWATFLSVLIVFMFLSLELERLQSNVASAKSQELNIAVAKVNEVNKLASGVLAINQGIVYPQDIFNLLARAKNTGITLSFQRVNFTTGEVTLSGVALTRADLLAFKDSLEKQEKFSEVNLPLSNLIEEVNINFEVRLFYKDLVKTKKAPARLQLQ